MDSVTLMGKLERLGVINEGRFALHASGLDFSPPGSRLDLSYGVHTAQGLLNLCKTRRLF